MVIGDSTPVWSDLGQTATVRHRIPGRRQGYCPDVYGDDCPAEELFGLGTVRIPDQDSMGQVMFPNIKRADYAVNPLSGFGVPGHDAIQRFSDDNSSEMFGLGEDVFGVGQVLFPNIKRADYAVNPLSGLGTVRIPDTESMGTVRIPDADSFGTVRVPDDSNAFAGYFGQEAPAAGFKAQFSAWNGAGVLATALLYGASMFAKGGLKEGLRVASYVAGGMTAVGLTKKLLG
jgi:hypothetical protein